ncbi:MAG: H-NS histone family protein [Magnetococcus sp. DMHC-8]
MVILDEAQAIKNPKAKQTQATTHSKSSMATDRDFRIGQKRNVLVHKFVCQGTLEDKIDALIESKKAITEDLLVGTNEIKVTNMQDSKLLKLIAFDMLSLAQAAGFESIEAFVADQRADEQPHNDHSSGRLPRYQNPDNPHQTWTGRGRRPNWVLKHLDGGGRMEELESA